jgi:DNA-binding Lrp family transcriptional regulator
VKFVKEAAVMPKPTVGITGSPIPPGLQKIARQIETDMCDLDYKIIRSLHNDSRKPTSQIAEEIGVAAKTVRRRLTRMQKNFLIQLSIDWYPDEANDIISIFHINTKPEANPNAVDVILQKYYPNTLFYWSFSNLPGSYVFMVWTPTSKELREVRESFEREPSIQSVTPNVIYTGYIFQTWRNQIP